jgi:3-oxoacyl-[acyl-carrier-protein] synthase-3
MKPTAGISVGARVVGWGSAVPPTVVTNTELAEHLGVSEAWIVDRTGIRERRIGSTTQGLAAQAGMQALGQAGVTPAEIDMLILATTTPDVTVPATASLVAGHLGLTCGAFDVNGACAGFVYSLVAGCGLLRTGRRRILVIGSDVLSTITDRDDRGTAILLADAAGAVVVEAADPPAGLLAWDAGTEPSAFSIAYCELQKTFTMVGREVFRRAVQAGVESASRALAAAGLKPSDVRLFVPHQANRRIISSLCERLGIPEARTAIAITTTGNTSSASIPLALSRALNDRALKADDIVLLCGFGAGMTWSSAVFRWS